ncbi:hypothetical protein ACFOWE_27135 [Planomonospora corallina]|uniref:Uncharacterized protein n=1 Tax=Planomonospora corallina TaxID=1806052 RepID=A0ABV8IG75_9ACTN
MRVSPVMGHGLTGSRVATVGQGGPSGFPSRVATAVSRSAVQRSTAGCPKSRASSSTASSSASANATACSAQP